LIPQHFEIASNRPQKRSAFGNCTKIGGLWPDKYLSRLPNPRPPAPEPHAAPFTKEELIDGIADCVAALLAQRDEKIAERGAKLDAVLQILGTGKSGDIIDLPENFWRRNAARGQQ
jgi:hypothetical protein